MYTIKLDINDTLYDKIMFFLKRMPVKSIVVEKDDTSVKQQDDIVHFFQSSPLVGEISLERFAKPSQSKAATRVDK